MGLEAEGRDYKGEWRDFVVQYLDCGYDFMGVYLCHKLSSSTHQTCTVDCKSIIPQ